MAALYFDVSRLNHYGPHEEMFASKIKTIQGKPLCNFLREMDQAEYRSLVKESSEIVELSKGGLVGTAAGGAFAALFVGGMACIALGPIGILGGLAGAYGGGYLGHHYGNTMGDQISSKIIADRVSRLFQKQLAIQVHLRTLIESNNLDEVEQLRIVEHYFHIQQTKWEADLAAVHHTLTVRRTG